MAPFQLIIPTTFFALYLLLVTYSSAMPVTSASPHLLPDITIRQTLVPAPASASSPAPVLLHTITTANSESNSSPSSQSDVCKTTRNAFVVPCAEHGKRNTKLDRDPF